MKIERTTGCICDCFEADGKPMCSMSEEELKCILLRVAQKIASRGEMCENQKCDLQSIIGLMVESFPDECECSEEPCECCGDYVETYIVEV